jgi:hypothetical protein
VLILAIYLLSQMGSVCESYRTLIRFSNNEKVKGQTSKKSMLTSTKLFHDADVEEVGDDMWQPVTRKMMQTWTNGSVTLVKFQANVVVPRGPGMGTRGTQSAVVWQVLKVFGSPWVLNPRPMDNQILGRVMLSPNIGSLPLNWGILH